MCFDCFLMQCWWCVCIVVLFQFDVWDEVVCVVWFQDWFECGKWGVELWVEIGIYCVIDVGYDE